MVVHNPKPRSILSKSNNSVKEAITITNKLKPIAIAPPSNKNGSVEPNARESTHRAKYTSIMAITAEVTIERNFSVTLTKPER